MNRTCAVLTPIFRQTKCLMMNSFVIVAAQQPLRIDAEFTHERRDDVDERLRVDSAFGIRDELLKRLWPSVEDRGEHVKRRRFVRNQGPETARDGSDEGSFIAGRAFWRQTGHQPEADG